ncbi:hypothetical protein GCM10028822_40420 [Hymenobacter terrigena]
MKKTTLLLFVCWFLALGRVAAQSGPPRDSVRLYLDNMFANLDPAQVPTPYLEEYGFRFAPLRLFAGTLQDSNRTTATLWRLLYASVLSGNINGPCNLPMLPDLNAALNTQATAGPAIPVLVQRLNYAALRPDAVAAGLLTGQNEQLFDVPGRTQSPYQVRTLFAAAPARSTAPTGDVSFVFAPALHVQSGGGSVAGISLDFGDGRGYLPVTWNQPLAASYGTAGTKRVKVRLTYNNGSIYTEGKTGGANKLQPPLPQYISYESHFDLEVLAPAAGSTGAARYAVDGFVQSFPAVMGSHSGGKVYVRFGGALGSRTRITKPLIVAEGYDLSSVAPAVQSNISIQDFLDDIRVTGGFNLYNALQNESGLNGYDIIYIDYNNGTDDIRRNAALFEEVMRWVNNQKVVDPAISAKQQNVVLGISMGGLVARYGLAEMEKRGNDPTDTRLLLTHDAPHRGANTPLGLQALTRQGAGTLAGQFIRVYNSTGVAVFFPKLALFPILQQADDLLDAPATRQLLLVRATRQLLGPVSSFGYEYNSFVNGDYRTMITPNPGQTFPYAFKATSLGSQCGIGLFAPHTELVRIEGAGYISVFQAGTGLHTEIIVNAMPNGGQVERVSGLRVWQQLNIFGFSRKIYLTRSDYQSPADNPIAWDGLPGGTQRINGQISLTPGMSAGSWGQFPFPVFGYSFNVALANNFCFIPTASALDVPLFDNVTTRSSYISNATTGPSQPLASRFIAQGPDFDPNTGQSTNNFEHPRFPGRQAQWLFNEMESNFAANAQLTCASECSLYPTTPLPITGPDIVCANGSATFTVAPPFGGVTGWSASPAGLVTLPTTTAGATSISVVPASGSSTGLVTLTAQISNGCYSTTASRRVAVGQGFLVIDDNDQSERCAEPTTSFTLTEVVGVQGPFTWQVSQGTIQAGQGTNTITVSGLPAQQYQLLASVTAPSACPGASDVSASGSHFYIVGTPGQYCSMRPAARRAAPTATLYPNPARETVDVHVENADAVHPVTVRLYDGYGRPRAEQTSTGAASVRLATDKLPAGLYFVHILRGKEVLSRQQLRIEK